MDFDFFATLHDTQRGRNLARMFTDKLVNGVSVEIISERIRPDPSRECRGMDSKIFDEARLLAVSISTHKTRPAWFGTHVAYTPREI